LAFDNAGSSNAARMAMIAMTTSNSINVNPREAGRINETRLVEFEGSLAVEVENADSFIRAPG
jgi:hypothetical protein